MKKVILTGVIILAVIGIGLFILLGFYTDRVIDPYVRSLLEQQKPMDHRIEYDKISVNLFKGSIRIRDVRLYPDSAMVKEENLWAEIGVSTIRLTGFRLRDVLFNKALNIGDLLILNPDIVIHLPVKPPQEVIEAAKVTKSKKEKPPLLTSISLDRILFSGGNFRLMHDSLVIASSPDINLLVSQIRLEKNSRNEPIGYSYDEVKINLSSIDLQPESGLYDMDLGSISLDRKDSSLVLRDFRMVPKYDKKEFSGHLPFQNDRFDVAIGRIDIKGYGFLKVLAGDPLVIKSLRMDSVNADIYRDKNVAFNLNRFPLFYNESFMKIPVPVYLDSLEVTNSRIQYGELAEGRAEAGIIILESFSLQSSGLTNQVEQDTAWNAMRLKIQAKVMGEGNLDAEIILPLEGDLRAIECSGSVGAMQLSPLNAMLEPSINMKFNAGRVNRMTFHFTANDNLSQGWMEFLYNDLDVVLLKKEPEKQWGFVSLLANTMTLSNNPAPGKNLKIVAIGCERDKNKGLINYVWKTIQSGMVHTILPIKKFQINRKHAEEKGRKGEEEKGRRGEGEKK